MRNKKIIFILVFLVFITSCTKYETILINTGEEVIELKVEIADTPEKREKGLQFRKHLDENSGMLFAFSSDATYSFWMKNTLIPLDLIFLSRDLDIVEIIHAEPCEEEPCETYDTKKYSRYVLEVNGNFTTNNNIKVGDRITRE